MPGVEFLTTLDRLAQGTWILDAAPFFREDEDRPGALPHCWDVTSDTLAARGAKLLKARELILLKSATWDGTDWSAASRAGLVDAYFAAALADAPGLPVRWINLRA